jgi:hypothetical protein
MVVKNTSKNASKNKNKKNNKYKKTKLKRTKVMYGGAGQKVKKTFKSAPAPAPKSTKFRAKGSLGVEGLGKAKGSISATGAKGNVSIPGVGTFGAKVNLSKLGSPGALTVTQKKPSMFSWSQKKQVDLSTATNLVGKTLSSASSQLKELAPEARNFLGNKPGFVRRMVEKAVRLGTNAAKYSEELHAKATREGATASGFDPGQGTKRVYSAAELTPFARKFAEFQARRPKILEESHPKLQKIMEETGIKLDDVTQEKYVAEQEPIKKMKIMTEFLSKQEVEPEKKMAIIAEALTKTNLGDEEKKAIIFEALAAPSATSTSSSVPGAQSAISAAQSAFKSLKTSGLPNLPKLSGVPSLSQMMKMGSMASKLGALR